MNDMKKRSIYGSQASTRSNHSDLCDRTRYSKAQLRSFICSINSAYLLRFGGEHEEVESCSLYRITAAFLQNSGYIVQRGDNIPLFRLTSPCIYEADTNLLVR